MQSMHTLSQAQEPIFDHGDIIDNHYVIQIIFYIFNIYYTNALPRFQVWHYKNGFCTISTLFERHLTKFNLSAKPSLFKVY